MTHPDREQLLAEIEKGQQLGGHQPSPEALELAAQILDGTIGPDQARAQLIASYTPRQALLRAAERLREPTAALTLTIGRRGDTTEADVDPEAVADLLESHARTYDRSSLNRSRAVHLALAILGEDVLQTP